MQRYHGASCTNAVNNSATGGASVRDASRTDPSSIAPNFSLNSRRSSQLTAYQIKCNKEPLNSRLGPPDFHPQTPNCPEETLTTEYVISGYRETVEGLEEAREISLSQIQTFTDPVILKCKEALKRRHRAINEKRAQKRKAGQVYGVPLSGTLLSKPGIFPEQRSFGEEFRKKWIESLSQPHKRLRSLADSVPHGYRRRSMFEVLIRNNVPLSRATWFIKVTYLNQVRPGSSGLSSGVPDKTQFSRSEQWTKDVIEYLQSLLDEFSSGHNPHFTSHLMNRPPQMVYPGSVQHKNDSLSAAVDGEEPSLHFKWWYAVRILQWHHAEGLLIPSLVIDWVLCQLQGKELLGILQLLFPIIYGNIETIVLSQTYVRSLVGIAIRFIREPSPGGSDLVENSRKAYAISALVEMLRYLILAVPDTFVALDCFPLPSSVVIHGINDGSFMSKVGDSATKIHNGPLDVARVVRDKGLEVASEFMSVDHVVSSIQKSAENLARATKPGYRGQNMAIALQELDRALTSGDVRVAYRNLFENLSDGVADEQWIAEVSYCLRSSLKYISTVSPSVISSVFFICEWATCDFRDFRTAPPRGLKFTGKKDVSQIYVAVRLLKLRMRDVQSSLLCKDNGIASKLVKDPDQLSNFPGRSSGGKGSDNLNLKSGHLKPKNFSDLFESPGSLHDMIVCWIDQHEVQNSEGFKHLQLLVIELIRARVFYPQAYVRQLIVSGIMDRHVSLVDRVRQQRHYKILKQLPAPYVQDALEEAQIAELKVVSEVVAVYSNERRLLLDGLLGHCENSCEANSSYRKQKHFCTLTGDNAFPSSVDECRHCQSASSLPVRSFRRSVELEDLKSSISLLLRFPCSFSSTDAQCSNQGTVKKSAGSSGSKMDISEGTPGCEECRRAKRQKLSEEKSSYLLGCAPNPSDEEETWWARKGQKSLESFKADPPPKPAKQASRGRQKVVRKTQSLAQLAAARIEGSQGASTSHVCDSRVSCPPHRAAVEGDAPNFVNGIRVSKSADIVSISKVLKQLRFVEKRTIAVWLIAVVKQLIEEAEKVSTVQKVGHYGRPLTTVDNKVSVRWKLGEDELSAILYLMDVSSELISAVKFLLWLLPKVPRNPSSIIHGNRNVLMLPRNVENLPCEISEAFLISSIKRYENIIVAADLIPETLSSMMNCTAATMVPNGRVSSSPALLYARHLLKKYGNIASVVDWEKRFKLTCDERLAAEFESGRLLDSEFGFPLGVPAGVEDLDEFFRQKITGIRVSRVGFSMRDIVQRHVDDVFHCYCGKERKPLGPSSIKSPGIENIDDGYQIAQQIVMGLMECMRQTGGAAQEGDPSLVSSAISAIVGSVGQVMAKIPDLTAGNNHLNFSSTSGSMNFAKRILRIHLTCLCLLKEVLGERQGRVFEVALASESSSVLVQILAPGKAPRSQFQLSPESLDSNANLSNDTLKDFVRVGRAVRIVAAVSALVIEAIVHGLISLERMATLFRLKEGLDFIQFVRNMRSNSNGNARSIGALKVDNLVEVSVHWFRLLVGNCRTVSDGFIVDLLGEPAVMALSRMQRNLPLNLVFPPAYSIFAFLLWRPFIVNNSTGIRDDIQQLYQSLVFAFDDAIKHLPFRDVCLRDTHGLHDLMGADAVDSEFAVMLQTNGLDMHLKANAFVPLRSKLFLHALIDCKAPQTMRKQDEGNRISGYGESKLYPAENGKKLNEKLVHVLDTLQPAKFHWQWLELRLLLNEQAVAEKLEAETSLVEAIRSLSPNPEKAAASENENNFIEILLTRLLVRPDAAPLFSEVVHLLGRSLKDSILLQVKWFLGGHDVLYGRKNIRQRLLNIAEGKGLSTKGKYWKPWGWCNSTSDSTRRKGNKRKFEVSSLEEGEVVDEGPETKRSGRGSTQVGDVEGFLVSQEHVTERALIDLVLPCLDKGSDDSRNTFASDMIKQMYNIEQQISATTRGASKAAGPATSGAESPVSKGSGRKGSRGGSPGLARRSTGSLDMVPPSPVALRASLSLRLQFLLRLLPIICADREPSSRNMRHILSTIILRLLGSRLVHEDAGLSFNTRWTSTKRDVDLFCSASVSVESLFDCLLLVLHGLLSSCQPSWLKLKSRSKSSTDSSKEFLVFDREVVESLQNDLDHMHLPEQVRCRIQAAMPILSPSVRWSTSCQPPSVSPAALAALQPSHRISTLHTSNSNLPQRNQSLVRSSTRTSGKPKPLPVQQDLDLEIDPWTLLEDGAGSGQSSSASSIVEHANLKASNWLKGAVRVRRTDLTYIGAVDEDS